MKLNQLPCPAVEAFERGEDPVRTRVDGVREDGAPADSPITVEDEESAAAGPGRGVVDAVGPRDGALRRVVRQQWEPQPVCAGEGGVGPKAVGRNSDEPRAEPLELRQQLLVERELGATDWVPVGHVEGEDDRPAAEVV